MFKNIALKVSFSYLAVATAWILLTDALLKTSLYSVEAVSFFQTFKGMFFVLTTAVGLYIIIRLYVGKLEKTTIQLRQRDKELSEINERLSELVQEETKKRVESEKAIFQQSKMVLLGEMLGAISHHWRQPLTAVGLKIQDVSFAYKNNELNEQYLKDFERSSMFIIQNMSKMIDDFRNFFSPNGKAEEFSLETMLNETTRLLSAKFANNDIELQTEGDNNTNAIYKGFRQELQQSVLNILLNACDAIAANDKQRFIKIKTSYQDKTAKIIIEDSGGGISDAVRERIYDPYFSTKGQGNGVGTGLYMSKEIIEKQLKGKLYDENSEFGARFVIELPLP